jgi:hypothetical protein
MISHRGDGLPGAHVSCFSDGCRATRRLSGFSKGYDFRAN